jgi:hypothetical protein
MLSILTRLGNDGIDLIPDLNMCLLAQHEQDFEWIILCRPSIDSLNLANDARFQWGRPGQIKFIETNTNSRGGCLNIGLRESTGSHITVLDDDDMVFSNFVSEFIRLQSQHKQQNIIFRTQIGLMTVENLSGTAKSLSSTAPVRAFWPTSFNPLEHLLVNQSPCHALSFPRTQIKEHNISWDENLSSVEDWDFLTNCLQYMYVLDNPCFTGIYRQPKKQSRSKKLETNKNWSSAEATVRKRNLCDRKFDFASQDIFLKPQIQNNFTKFDKIAVKIAQKIPRESAAYRFLRRFYRALATNK